MGWSGEFFFWNIKYLWIIRMCQCCKFLGWKDQNNTFCKWMEKAQAWKWPSLLWILLLIQKMFHLVGSTAVKVSGGASQGARGSASQAGPWGCSARGTAGSGAAGTPALPEGHRRGQGPCGQGQVTELHPAPVLSAGFSLCFPSLFFFSLSVCLPAFLDCEISSKGRRQRT